MYKSSVSTLAQPNRSEGVTIILHLKNIHAISIILPITTSFVLKSKTISTAFLNTKTSGWLLLLTRISIKKIYTLRDIPFLNFSYFSLIHRNLAFVSLRCRYIFNCKCDTLTVTDLAFDPSFVYSIGAPKTD